MNLEQAYQKRLTQLNNIDQRVNVFFEAHYWGRFRLLTNEVELFSDPQGYRPIAQIQSPPYDQWLLLDPERKQIVIRQGDTEEPIFIAQQLTEFWSDADWEEALNSKAQEFYFDRRESLAQILPSDAWLITPFTDPEDFEELKAYRELLEYIEQITQGLVNFDEIKGKEKGIQKTLVLRRGERTWSIALNNVLFDQVFIDQLNQIIIQEQISERQLATSISPELAMVLLWIDTDQGQQILQRGLLL